MTKTQFITFIKNVKLNKLILIEKKDEYRTADTIVMTFINLVENALPSSAYLNIFLFPYVMK